MIYITIDTCVWLRLLREDLYNLDNLFEEFCYWFENNYLTHITPQNIIREWDRNKVPETLRVIGEMNILNRNLIALSKGNQVLSSVYQPDIVQEIIEKRVERVDSILKTYSEIALESPKIFEDSISRNLNCLAPNHSKDSFRDTVNILTLIDYIKDQGYTNCYFTTRNYTDFSVEKIKKHYLHQQLVLDFQNASLTYVFFDDEPIGGKLLSILRPQLPSYEDFCKVQANIAEARILEEKKELPIASIENPDQDFLQNIKYIDLLLSKKVRTGFEEEMILSLIKRHESYKQYFFKNVGDNGMV